MKRPRSRVKHKGRRDSGTFTRIPHAVQDCANWRQCSATAIKLLCDLARQYNGHNNGDMCAALTLLKQRGWSSPETVSTALKELRHYGFIELTRQGGLIIGASLFSLTWLAIDECDGKLDCAATAVASGSWKTERPRFLRTQRKNANTPSVAARYAIRSDEGEISP